jgi:putative hemolysin
MNADPESQSLLAQILLLIVLTLVNAFLAASEMSLVSINRNRVEQKAEEGDTKSQKLLKILENPTNFLSTIQVGITLVNILTGASLADSLSSYLAPYLGGGAAAIRYIGIIAKPFVWLLSASTNLLSRLTPMTFDDEDAKMTRDEMRYMMETEGVFEDSELEMLQGIFSLDTKVAREVMVPRTDAFMVDIHDDVKENMDKILAENFSRIPVYNEDKDKVIGVLHTKTLLKSAYNVGFDNLDLKELLQEPLFVPETVFIDDLLYELKKTQNQMAILLDEYGGVVGLVTLEDLLEEIVGEIDDESDEIESLYEKISEDEYIIQGRMLIDDFNELFHTNLHMSDVDTMAGYFITALGTIPDEDDKLSFDVDNVTLTSEEMEGTRVLKLRAKFREDEVDIEPEEERRFFRKDFEEDEPRR